jgi:hypothetical protein
MIPTANGRVTQQVFEGFKFYSSWGVNFFPFNPSLVRTSRFRFSTGFLILMGSTSTREWIYDQNAYLEKINPVFIGLPIWNNLGRFYISDHFQVTWGVDVSLPKLDFICPQFGISYGF